jgi:integrase
MRYRLTDRTNGKLPAPDTGNRLYFDTEVRELALRVTAAGARAWVITYTVQGRTRRYTIGAWPDWSTALARDEARRVLRDVDLGNDPLAGRQAFREAPTVAELAERFEREVLPRNRPATRAAYRHLLKAYVLPSLGRLKVAAVTHADVERMHREATQHGAYVANRALAMLGRMMSLAVKWQICPDNPARGIERNHEERRTRYLTAEEVARLSEVLAGHTNRQSANIVRLLLLTGARKGEVLSMRWEDLDLEAGVWTKPSSHTKQKKEHRVPLSAPARELLAGIERSGPWVFPGDTAEGHQSDIKRFWAAVRKKTGIRARPHDLRHTYASVLASSGASLPLIGALLGHSLPQTTARYAHLFDDPLRAATERVGAIVTGKDKAPVRNLK